MEKEKKLKIAVIILAIIAILEFLVIVGDDNTSIQTNGDTNVTYADTSSNKNMTDNNAVPKTTDEEIKKNIQVESAGITASGDFVLKVTNNNDDTVIIDNIETIFKDENNVFAQKEQTNDSWFGIQAHKTIYVYNWGYKKDFTQYPNYEFNVNLCSNRVAKSYCVDNFEMKANNSGEQIAVEVKNNNNSSVENIEVNAIFYKNGEIVGIVSGSDILSNSTSSQSSSYINIEYPKDSKYNEIDFDNYEVFLISSRIED